MSHTRFHFSLNMSFCPIYLGGSFIIVCCLQSQLDLFDWSRHKGGTASSSTGPSFDHTLGNADGYYMYIEASDNEAGDFAWLTSAMGPSTRGSCLHFWWMSLKLLLYAQQSYPMHCNFKVSCLRKSNWNSLGIFEEDNWHQ